MSGKEGLSYDGGVDTTRCVGKDVLVVTPLVPLVPLPTAAGGGDFVPLADAGRTNGDCINGDELRRMVTTMGRNDVGGPP